MRSTIKINAYFSPKSLLKAILFLPLPFTLVLLAQHAHAQTATLVGTVRDQTKAVLPGVEVVAKNVHTAFAKKAITNDSGDYIITLLPPGTYRVSATLSGFKRAETPDLVLQVDQRARLDFVLQIGTLEEEVTVMAAAPLVNTETPTLGQVIPRESIMNLPLNGREFYQLAALVPGAQTGNVRSGFASKGGQIEFNGARSVTNNFRVDGGENTDGWNNQIAYSPSVDAIHEFKVKTNMYSAEHGRALGAVIDVVTRSGTNRLHGSLWEYHRNSVLDAKNFFALEKAPFKQNQFGWNLGGPVKKNKTFFFVNYEGFRQRKGLTQVFQVPTDRERRGDFSQSQSLFRDAQGNFILRDIENSPPDLLSPATFPGRIIPTSRFSQLGLKLLAEIPRENNPGDPFRNFIHSPVNRNDRDNFLTRIDHKFSDSDSFFATVAFDNRRALNPWLNKFSTTRSIDRSRLATVNWVHSFSPRALNEFRFSYNRLNAGVNQLLTDKDYTKEFGFGWHPKGRSLWGFPRILCPPLVTCLGAGDTPFLRSNNTFNYVNNFSHHYKGHFMKTGVDVRRFQFNWIQDSSSRGTYFFRGFNSGNGWADMLLGLTDVQRFSINQEWFYFRQTQYAWYFQDDWKVLPNLTLNIGLRYELTIPFSEKNHRLTSWDPTTGQLVYDRDAPLGEFAVQLRFPHRVDGGPHAIETQKKNFAPRFGFAWRPFANNKTAVRGGYGIFWLPPTAFFQAFNAWVPPWAGELTFAARPFSPVLPIQRVEEPDPRLMGGRAFFTFTEGLYNEPNFKNQYMQNWNLAIQHEIVPDLSFEAAYVGGRGVHLSGGMAATPFCRKFLGEKCIVGAFYPGHFIGMRVSAFNSWYHSMQLKAEHRFSRGLSFLASYTYGKALDIASSEQTVMISDQADITRNALRLEKALADFDVRHRFVLSGVYDLPFGRGRFWGRDWSGVAEAIFGGWRANFILVFNTGHPFNVGTFGGSARPDRICDGNIPPSQRTINRWFDVSCFVPPKPGTIGNAGRNVLDGPGFKNVDFGIMKSFRIKEGHSLEFRAEFFNLTNTPNFFIPLPSVDIRSQDAAKINRAFEPRDIQFALRYGF